MSPYNKIHRTDIISYIFYDVKSKTYDAMSGRYKKENAVDKNQRRL